MSAAFGELSVDRAKAVGEWIENLHQPGFHWTKAQYLEALPGRSVFGEQSDPPRAAILWADVGSAVEILAVMTHPQAQRQGLMRRMGPEFFRHIQGLRPEVWLEVHAQNHAARALYAAWGFTQVGERPHYYGPGQSAILMTKTLPSPV